MQFANRVLRNGNETASPRAGTGMAGGRKKVRIRSQWGGLPARLGGGGTPCSERIARATVALKISTLEDEGYEIRTDLEKEGANRRPYEKRRANTKDLESTL